MARGNYQREITEKPGTCGACLHFKRGQRGEIVECSGKCAVKPGVWLVSQSFPACKKHYKGKEKAKQ